MGWLIIGYTSFIGTCGVYSDDQTIYILMIASVAEAFKHTIVDYVEHRKLNPRARENWFHLALESLGCANGSISTYFNYGSYQYPYKSSDDVCYGSYQYPYKSSADVCLHIWSNTPVINIWCKTSNRIALIRMDKEIFASQTTWSGIWHNAFF